MEVCKGYKRIWKCSAVDRMKDRGGGEEQVKKEDR